MSILIGILTFVLILVSLFMVLVVLAQKAKDGGVGAALGGGATEAAINAAIAFFVLSFILYLGHIYQRKHAAPTGGSLPTITVPATPTAMPEVPSAAVPTSGGWTPPPAAAEQPKTNP